MLRYGEYFTKTYVIPDGFIVQAPADIPIASKEIMPLSAKENGDVFTPWSFKYCAKVIHEELGNPLFHSHCLRHTHGTILAENCNGTPGPQGYTNHFKTLCFQHGKDAGGRCPYLYTSHLITVLPTAENCVGKR